MSATFSWKPVIAITAVMATSVTMSACGKEEKSAEPGTSHTPPATSALESSTSAAPVSSEQTSVTPAPDPDASAAPSKSQAAPAPAPAPAGSVGSADQQGLQPIQPAQGPVDPVQGRPGTPQEIAGITEMLRRPEQQTTMHGYMNNMVDSLCTELIEQNGGHQAFSFNEIPDLPLNQIPEYNATRTTLTGVENVTVDGENASANVTTSKGSGESETMTMRFRNEGGAWKLCS